MVKTLSIFILLVNILMAGETGLLQRLKTIPGITVQKQTAVEPFTESFKIFIEQPLDHQNPSGQHFKQQIILSHRSFSAPTVLVTEGYGFYGNHTRELSTFLKANEIRVEHRFFGLSRPDSMDWSKLTIAQESADYHLIVTLFKKIYPGKWINTGWSKGGQTAVFHRYFYPEDVDASVAYDAPFNLEREESRIDSFFSHVGSASCRQKIKSFQKTALRRKMDLLPLMRSYAEQKQYGFSIGMQAALEYAILEYPFSFWQYHKLNCDSIPDNNAFPETIFRHLKNVVSFSSYSDKALDSPAMYQFFTELGYYSYVTKGLESWLSGAYGYSNALFAPRQVAVEYHSQPMRDIERWLRKEASKILFIYGENDPWSAAAIRLSGKTDALKMVLKKGNHFTFIQSFNQDEQTKIIHVLKRWLDIK